MDRRQWIARAGTGLAASTLLAATAAQAATARKPAATRAEPAAPVQGYEVEAVQMPAWSVTGGQRNPLAPGDVVAGGQDIETGAGAALVLRMPEGSLVRLGEKTKLGVQRLEVDTSQGSTAVRSEISLLQGFFRFATSSVSKAVGKRDITIALKTTTVGIRGTDFWSMTDAVHDAVCLFEGKVDLATQEQGALVLDKPTAFWARFFDKPVQPVGNATPDQLNTFLGSTELKPGTGIAVAGGTWRVLALESRDSRAALQLAGRLRAEGYPAILRSVPGQRGQSEVVIDSLATQQDAQAVLARVGAMPGVSGRVLRAG